MMIAPGHVVVIGALVASAFWQSLPTRTQDLTGSRPGDPVNVAVVGSRLEVTHAFAAAGWLQADPISVKSVERIAIAACLNLSYPRAPMSPQMLYGRWQDLSLEVPGPTVHTRHHVRLWLAPQSDPTTHRPLWLGAATYDDGIELPQVARNLCAGAIITRGIIPTHHVSPRVDRERKYLRQTLLNAHVVLSAGQVPGTEKRYCSNVAHGDAYCTDGKRIRLVLAPYS